MTKLFKFYLPFLAIAFLTFTGCEPKDPDDVNEEELITTLIYTVTNSDTNESSEFIYKDLDGDGTMEPTITNVALKSSSSYTAEISLLNETETPAESIDAEVKEEDLDHQFFFVSDVLNLAYTDMDSNGNPLGLSTSFTTGEAGSGSLEIILRHKPAKDAAGVKDNDITNAGGDTDIQVKFDVVVED